MSTIEFHGRTIRHSVGVADRHQYRVTGPHHWFILAGPMHTGAPGPIVLIMDNGQQTHVSNAGRFGDQLDLDYVKAWIEDEDGIERDERPQPLNYQCPACGAKPRAVCTQPTSTGRRDVPWFHTARYWA